jgi:mono/diheme cytochrome c family protein
MSSVRAFIAIVMSVAGATGVSTLAACGDNDEHLPASVDAAVDASPPIDAPEEDPAVTRGRYLVNNVVACGDCHSPRNPDGSFMAGKEFSGVECFLDVDPTDADVGCLHSRNLTNHATGLATRSAAEIKDMFQNGVRPNGQFLSSVMPYYVFHNMTAADADAVVAYLRTLPGVDHQVPASQPPWNAIPAAVLPLLDAEIPAAPAGNASAERGRYLAAKSGLCIECHTQHTPPGSAKALDVSKVFQGGEAYPSAAFGLPVPPFPEVIYSANITPHANGLAGRTVAQVVAELKQGVDPGGNGICPPMPAGPMAAYGGLTDADATDIATYILSLPPGANLIPNGCAIPHP